MPALAIALDPDVPVQRELRSRNSPKRGQDMTCRAGLCVWFWLPFSALLAQEANSGLDLSATVTGQAAYGNQLTERPRSGSPVVAGFRSMLYPTFKISKHWVVSGAIDVNSRPYFEQDFSTRGYGIETHVIQANIGYSNVWKRGSVVARAGQLSSAFGAFLLRYDDAVNPLLNMPMQYGYYSAVTTAGLTGAQVDANPRKMGRPRTTGELISRRSAEYF